MPRPQTPGLIEAIVALLPLGLTQSQIAKRVGCNQSYVSQVARDTKVGHQGPRKVYSVAAMEATIRDMARKGHSKNAVMRHLRIGWDRLNLLLADMPDVVWRERGDTLECIARQAIPKVITGFIPGGKKRKSRCRTKRKPTSKS